MFGLTDYVIVIVINALNSEDKKPTNFFDNASTIRVAARNTIYRDTIGNQHARSDIQKQAYLSERVPTIREAYGLTGTRYGTHTPYINGKPVSLDENVIPRTEVVLIKNDLHTSQALKTAGMHRIIPMRTEPSFGSKEQFETVVDIILPPEEGGPPSKSFAPNGKIVDGTKITIKNRKDLVTASAYVIEHEISQLVVSTTGDKRIFISVSNSDPGQLIKSPYNSQVPIVFDALQTNVGLDIDNHQLHTIDASFEDGFLGKGTYILGSDFPTTWGSIKPNIRAREDFWGDTIGFFNEPTTDKGPFRLLIMSKLINSVLFDHVDSVFADNLFKSGIPGGMMVIEAELTGDPMKAFEDGTFICVKFGTITIGYLNNADLLYPEILITPIGPDGTE